MSICSSGVSAPKAGVASAVIVDANYVKTLLPSGLAWLYDYLPYMRALEIGSVAAFCAVDPPAFTVPSAADLLVWLAAGGVQGLGSLTSIDTVTTFMTNIVKTYLWYGLCRCTSVATPAAPIPPAPPTGSPVVNPPQLTTTRGTPCVTVTHSLAVNPGTTLVVDTLGIPDGFNFGAGLYATSLDVIMSVTPTGAVHNPVKFSITLECNAFGVSPPDDELQKLSYIVNSGASLTVTIPIVNRGAGSPLTVAIIDVQANDTGSGSTDVAVVTVNEWCNGVGPALPSQPCCPPDPVITQRLGQILEIATLLQRQMAPFAYVSSTTHAGLTGSGSFAIQGILGVKVAITTLPSQLGQIAGTPVELFDAGYFTFGTPDGYPQSIRLEHNPQLSLPARCSAFTEFAYNLHPGVVVTVTELVREP